MELLYFIFFIFHHKILYLSPNTLDISHRAYNKLTEGLVAEEKLTCKINENEASTFNTLRRFYRQNKNFPGCENFYEYVEPETTITETGFEHFIIFQKRNVCCC